jgi:hypothetical protein
LSETEERRKTKRCSSIINHALIVTPWSIQAKVNSAFQNTELTSLQCKTVLKFKKQKTRMPFDPER